MKTSAGLLPDEPGGVEFLNLQGNIVSKCRVFLYAKRQDTMAGISRLCGSTK